MMSTGRKSQETQLSLPLRKQVVQKKHFTLRNLTYPNEVTHEARHYRNVFCVCVNRLLISARRPPAYRQAGGPDRGRGRQGCNPRFRDFFRDVQKNKTSPSRSRKGASVVPILNGMCRRSYWSTFTVVLRGSLNWHQVFGIENPSFMDMVAICYLQ